jgi:CxxC motif-containing protein
MEKEMICIVCPMGCHLTVSHNEKEDGFLVSGNKCNRGKAYAIEEIKNPKRMVPTTVTIEGGVLNRLPVKTKEPIPKGIIFEAMKVINQITVKAPIKCGDVIIENLLETGVSVVATRSMKHI